MDNGPLAILNFKAIFFFIILLSFFSEGSFVASRLNIPLDYQTNHTIIYSGDYSDVNITFPQGMIFLDGTPGYVLSSDQIFWPNVSFAKLVVTSNYAFSEGDVVSSDLYLDGSLSDTIDFVAVPDNKVGNCKSELGHGTSNWLDTSYLPAGDSSLFNMIRVFPLGSYYNEEAENASLNCTFPKYHILVSQGNLGTLIQHESSSINARFYWDNLGKNWFRVAPLEQEILSASVGDIYNIVCSDVNYQYTQGNVTAPVDCLSFEFRNASALSFSRSEGNITITNSEEYYIYDLEISWLEESGYKDVVRYAYLAPDDVLVLYFNPGNYTLSASFIPVWYKNSMSDNFVFQEYSFFYSVPVVVPLPYGGPRTTGAVVAVKAIELDLNTCTSFGIKGPRVVGFCWSTWLIALLLLIIWLVLYSMNDRIYCFFYDLNNKIKSKIKKKRDIEFKFED